MKVRLLLGLAILLSACTKHVDSKPPGVVLADDLREMRIAIANFRAGQHRYPTSLSELKTSHYLRDIPIDPITRSRNWRVTTEETVRTDDFISKPAPGNTTVVIDVHSNASGRDPSGKAYSEY